MKAVRYLNWRINRRVNAEDTELITRVQLGMQSPAYVAGPLGTSEVCLRSFARKLRRMIPEARLELRRRRAGRRAPHQRAHDEPGGAQGEYHQRRLEPGPVESEQREAEADRDRDPGDKMPRDLQRGDGGKGIKRQDSIGREGAEEGEQCHRCLAAVRTGSEARQSRCRRSAH